MSKNAGNIVLEAKNVVYYYKANKGKKVLDDISYGFEIGKMYAILGPSGSGKTTFLSLLAGLDSPTDGGIYYEGVNIRKKGLHNYRKKNMSLVFQNYNLVSTLSVRENIMLPLLLDGMRVDQKFLKEITESLKMTEKLDHMPHMLSGGQQQRVAIARALITKPAVILADEPTGNLDSVTGMEVVGLLKTSAERYHQTILLVTHNEEIAQMAERIIRIEDGKVTGDSDEK